MSLRASLDRLLRREPRLDAEEQQRLDAHAAFKREELRLRPAYKLWGYKNVFAKGFLLTRMREGAARREHWDALEFGPWLLQHDPLLACCVAERGDLGVLVLGHAFPEDGHEGRDQVGERLLRTMAGTDALAGSRDAVDEAISWISGRYLIFVRRGDALDVYGDPLATKSCYFHSTDAGIALASHTLLLSQRAGGLTSNGVRWIAQHPDYRSPAGKWLPGLITPHDGVGQLYANGRLEIDAGDQVQHRRFFPRAERVERTAPISTSRFATGFPSRRSR